MSNSDHIIIEGARENNLKNIDLKIPKNKLVVLTGLSGSGKSSLAFETLYAEGQRRYMESFGTYARQFIGGIERPDVDRITGLSPVIAIEQKSTNKNPRSTVGTITEIYDLLRLLFAKASTAYSYISGLPMQKYNEEEIIQSIFELHQSKKVAILSPLVRGRKGHYRDLFESSAKKGYDEMYIDGALTKLRPKMQLDRYKTHDISLVIDKLSIKDENKDRIISSIQSALNQGDGIIGLLDLDNNQIHYYSKHLLDIVNGISYQEPSSNTFSFNSPYGACPQCKGLGDEYTISHQLMMPDTSISLTKGGLLPLGEQRPNQWWEYIHKIAQKYKINLSDPIDKLSPTALNLILYGNEEGVYDHKHDTVIYNSYENGIVGFVYRNFYNSDSDGVKKWAESFMMPTPCSKCNGTRLKEESLYYKINDKNIADLSMMSIDELSAWFDNIESKLSQNQNLIAKDLLNEIRNRLDFLLNVGLGYLSLNRQTRSLSGGEAQRIRLATQIGTELSGVTYILDEPSIGLHPRDNKRLINSLKKLRELDNSIIVVEHDKEIMLESDYIIDIGPKAGNRGGQIVAQDTPKNFIHNNTPTALYLRGKLDFVIPKTRRKPKKWLTLIGATGHNLKNITVDIPLGVVCCITGVSGSGKSSLINETLYPILSQHFYKSHTFPLPYQKLIGIEHIDKVIDIDQSPIGRTPRSNPATFMKVFDLIRNLYAETTEAKIRGYKPGRFSFNVKGGRCEACEGAGLKTVEMNFLPDIQVKCEKCQGKRYNRETLDIRYKHLTIYDVLELSIDDAIPLFESIPNINIKLKTLQDIGLGYLKLGQPSTTISGGEAQRVKLASELCKRDTGKTLYILDEPTTGLHFQDIQMLYMVIEKLVEKGNSIIIIEHNLDVIKMADYIIDIGPEGGSNGGNIVAKGTPEEICNNSNSLTAKYLKSELKQ